MFSREMQFLIHRQQTQVDRNSVRRALIYYYKCLSYLQLLMINHGVQAKLTQQECATS